MSIFDSISGGETLEEKTLAVKDNPNISYPDLVYQLTHKGEPVCDHSLITVDEYKNHVEQFIADGGYVPTLPLLVHTMMQLPEEHPLKWNTWTSLSEEHYGIDTQGKYVPAGEVAVVTLHGRGNLRRDLLASSMSRNGNRCFFVDGLDFDALLDGELFFYEPRVVKDIDDLISGEGAKETIDLFTADDVRNERIPDIYGTYGVVTAYTEESTPRKKIKKEIMNSDLMVARLGSSALVEQFWERATTDPKLNTQSPDFALYEVGGSLLEPILKGMPGVTISSFLCAFRAKLTAGIGYKPYWGVKLQ